ncbi:MAG: putative DNA modification/repair radical SAM protein [Defluviitaleaceae bacterium]|nr:putative DNA modification/repair radical SAM protein [Defluviitaleaceae bacterium]
MHGVIIPKSPDRDELYKMMQENASHDVADGEAPAYDCGAYARKRTGSPPKVPKVFVTNNCVFDCQYCGMRRSVEKRCRYVNEPREIAEIAVREANKNGHGVFISSSVFRTPDYTEELIVETLKIIRRVLCYNGYVHAKIMPGADPRLIEQAGWLADRLSVNIELSRSGGYQAIAKEKNKRDILAPMSFICKKINENKQSKNRSAFKAFARSGQTTQVMAGAMGEDDRELITLAEALYKKFALRRVYYSAFCVPSHKPDCLPVKPTPFWRMRRLYQADRLLQLYGFPASDLFTDESAFLERDIDPKAVWALRNLSIYPVEIQSADYKTLLRVPGLGVESANKIINERKNHRVSHSDLKKMGVWMNRARYFITCCGKYDGIFDAGEDDPFHLQTDPSPARDALNKKIGRIGPDDIDALRYLLRDGTIQEDLGVI